MQTALFHNFTGEPFTGYWNGKAKTFKPGEKATMSLPLAQHFAKHLTNQELLKKGMENYTSPKNPLDVPEFMKLFNQACIVDSAPEQSDIDGDIKLATAAKASGDIDGSGDQPSMNIRVDQPKPIDQYDANAAPQTGPGEPQVITGPDGPAGDDDESFEGLKDLDNNSQ